MTQAVERDRTALERLIEGYCAIWGEPDATRRLARLQAVWGDGATYTDPTAHVVGREALSAHIGKVLEQYPGARVEPTSAIDTHHSVARFGWRMVLADGASLPDGIDFAEIGEDGKLRRIVGFFGALKGRE